MMKWINKKRNKKGFTLVELVVVIAILGILAAIAVPKLSGSRGKAADTAHEANIRTLEGAATTFIATEGAKEVTWSAKGGTKSDDSTLGDGDEDKWKDYLQAWPKVPSGITDDSYDDGEEYSVVIDEDGNITVSAFAVSASE